LPSGLRYIGISRFEDDPVDWPDGAWSVELEFAQPPAEQSKDAPMEAQVRFLFENAPQARLKPGAHFAVYEGMTRVATIDVLD
jgi:hypothetical protein